MVIGVVVLADVMLFVIDYVPHYRHCCFVGGGLTVTACASTSAAAFVDTNLGILVEGEREFCKDEVCGRTRQDETAVFHNLSVSFALISKLCKATHKQAWKQSLCESLSRIAGKHATREFLQGRYHAK